MTFDGRCVHAEASQLQERPLRGFKAALAAEVAKGKRAGARKVALIAPLPLCVLGLMSSGLVTQGHGPGGVGFNTYGWCWWYTLLLPVAVALITASVAGIDARQKFHGVMSSPVSLRSVWGAKSAYAFMLVAAANLVVATVSVAIDALGGDAAGLLASACMVVLLSVSSLWMVPAGLFLTARFGMLAGIAAPLLVQLGVGIALYGSGLWWLLPPAAAMRLCSPFAGVAPSGVPLMPGEIYGVIDAVWFVALAVSAVFGVLLVAAGAAWFARQEVR